jgi:hypothetical protein
MNEVQRAVFGVLSNDAVLADMGVGVYDDVPANETFPYIAIGEKTETGIPNTHSSFGRDVTLTVHVWSDQPAAEQTAAIASQAIGLLERQPLALADGWTWEATFFEMNENLRDPGGRHRHGVLRFRVRARRDF